MDRKALARFDALSVVLLLLWVGLALGLLLIAGPVASAQLLEGPVRQLLGSCFRRLDWLAWIAFGLPFLMSFGARWLEEVKDTLDIGPMRLWSAAALAALLACFASAAIVNPRLEVLRAKPLEQRAPIHRAQSIVTQLLVLRILLALGLAGGVVFLPKTQQD
jgi:hypothetical protein